jgi:hypothetical protein
LNIPQKREIRFSPDGLRRRHIAIDVPAGSLAGFEKLFMIASKFAGFTMSKGNARAQNMTATLPTESILITGESNWIQSKIVIWFI